MRNYSLTDVELIKRSAFALSEYDYISLGKAEFHLRVRRLHPQGVMVMLHHLIAKCRTANVNNGLHPCWDENYERTWTDPVPDPLPDLLVLDEAERALLPKPIPLDPRLLLVSDSARLQAAQVMAWMPPAPAEVRVAELLPAMIEAHGGVEGAWRSVVSQCKRVGMLLNPSTGVYVLAPAHDAPLFAEEAA